MTEFKIYDTATDEMVPLTQERLDEVLSIAMLFGMTRSIMRALMSKPMRDGKPDPGYKEMLRSMVTVADAFVAKTKASGK